MPCPRRCPNGSRCRQGRCVKHRRGATTAARRGRAPAAAKKKQKPTTGARRRRPAAAATAKRVRKPAAAKKQRQQTTAGRRKRGDTAAQRRAGFYQRQRQRRAGKTTAARRAPAAKAAASATSEPAEPSWKRFSVTYTCGRGGLRGYRLGKLMGEGLSGSVFASRHPRTGEAVAVKVYPVGVPIPGRFCRRLRHGANTKKATGCTDKVRLETKRDFDNEVRIARLMSKHGVGPGLVDAWLAADGRSSLEQTAPGSKRHRFPIGVIVTRVWDMSLGQYQKNVSRRLSGDNYAVAERELEAQTRAVDKVGYFNYDLRPDNVLVRVRGKKIVGLTLADYGGLDKKRRGDDNFKSLRAMLRKLR